MQSFRKFFYILLAVIFLIIVGFVVENNYSLIFSRHISGQIVGVQRVNSNLAVVNSGSSDSALFSFAVAVRDEKGVIHTASTEDRQWAVAKEGFCADAVFYPYPPWNFEKAGTYMNARLVQLRDCAPGTVAPTNLSPQTLPVALPAVSPTASP